MVGEHFYQTRISKFALEIMLLVIFQSFVLHIQIGEQLNGGGDTEVVGSEVS